ncbi:unnamed protein product [Effrenium voratum]|uniref:Uncharacterized protein n=1 Tax=Effrenium voratum TaxID=2562239 RepID=A0AA36JSF6_9DINO|nr:unnamed protein product [Effrenium voratum]
MWECHSRSPRLTSQPAKKGQRTCSTMAQRTLGAGWGSIEKAMECRCGQTERAMKASGRETKLMDGGGSFMRTGTSMRASGLQTQPTGKARTITLMGPNTKVSGSMTGNMGRA